MTVELKLKIFLMLNFEMEKEEAIQIQDLDKKYSKAQILELMDPLTLKQNFSFQVGPKFPTWTQLRSPQNEKTLTFRRWCREIKLIILFILMFVRWNTMNTELRIIRSIFRPVFPACRTSTHYCPIMVHIVFIVVIIWAINWLLVMWCKSRIMWCCREPVFCMFVCYPVQNSFFQIDFFPKFYASWIQKLSEFSNSVEFARTGRYL